jgi:hypothetical protein
MLCGELGLGEFLPLKRFDSRFEPSTPGNSTAAPTDHPTRMGRRWKVVAAFGLGWIGLILAIVVVIGLVYFLFGRSRV